MTQTDYDSSSSSWLIQNYSQPIDNISSSNNNNNNINNNINNNNNNSSLLSESNSNITTGGRKNRFWSTDSAGDYLNLQENDPLHMDDGNNQYSVYAVIIFKNPDIML